MDLNTGGTIFYPGIRKNYILRYNDLPQNDKTYRIRTNDEWQFFLCAVL